MIAPRPKLGIPELPENSNVTETNKAPCAGHKRCYVNLGATI